MRWNRDMTFVVPDDLRLKGHEASRRRKETDRQPYHQAENKMKPEDDASNGHANN